MKNYVIGVDYEEHEDGIVDFTVEVDKELFKQFGYNTDIEEDYMHGDLGTYYVRDGGTWFWAMPSQRITYNVRRSEIGNFYLTDSESAVRLPNTKFFREFKKNITKELNKVFRRFKRENSI